MRIQLETWGFHQRRITDKLHGVAPTAGATHPLTSVCDLNRQAVRHTDTQSPEELSMKILVTMFLALTATAAFAATTVLDPGDGRQYLQNWCGGQLVNEYAQGFDEASNALTAVKVTTRCSTGGRGTKPRTYLACWLVTFDGQGAIINQEVVNTGSWVQGQPPLSCALVLDAAAAFTRDDGATLTTTLVGTTVRAVLEMP
jgi:hypothetical protein